MKECETTLNPFAAQMYAGAAGAPGGMPDMAGMPGGMPTQPQDDIEEVD